MAKRTILHVIDFMGRGGAETMLVKVLQELSEYHNIVVTINEQNHFGADFVCDEYHCLKMGSFKNFPLAVIRMRRFLKGKNIDIVHTHLLLSTLVTRLALPKRIPLITTIHTNVALSNDYKKWYLRFLEKFTYKLHKNIVVGVSQTVLDGYFSFLKHKPFKTYLLYTFVDLKTFGGPLAPLKDDPKPFQLIAVGALRHPKNQQYLIEAFQKLPHDDFELHIYGIGVQENELRELIKNSKVNVVLKGEVKNINQIMNQYDAFVMPSVFEGFSLSVLEAMAMRMPILLSDIPTFREQCADTVLYFNLADNNDFISKLQQISKDKKKREELAIAARERAVANFSLEHHMKGLRKIYEETLNNSVEKTNDK